jgi:electron transfer flavoprotein alpha subunit
MKIAVLVKQIPAPAQLRLDGATVVRDGVDLEVNAYCRRANAKAVELAGDTGEVVVFTMGPPSAEDALREMLACGATRAVHLCDLAFAGADTLATARVLAKAIQAEGQFDLVLAGLNSLDADTGQVPAQVAEFLGLPFAPGIRDIEVTNDRFTARLETDDDYLDAEGRFPVMLSTAERLCAPSKAKPDQRAAVDGLLIKRLDAAALGMPLDECGVLGSPTTVGEVRVVESKRAPKMAASAAEAVDMLVELGAFAGSDDAQGEVPQRSLEAVREIWCSFRDVGVGAELLGEAAELAQSVGATVTAVLPADVSGEFWPLGADDVLLIPDAGEPAEWAEALAVAAADAMPWALLIEGTRAGRVVASIVAARNGWGLTGDAIGFDVTEERLVAWKPAFGGQLEAPIYTSSPVQMATVRPGVLPMRTARSGGEPTQRLLPSPPRALITTTRGSDPAGDPSELQRSPFVVSIGQGIEPDGYGAIDDLRNALGGAALGSTRKVTDKGWLPRSTQIGVTGHSIAPKLVVTVGASGRFNYTVGIRNAEVSLAIDVNPEAEIFDQVDIGLCGPWQELVPALTSELTGRALF